MSTKTKPRLNHEWHLANKMPERATLEQRIQWHRKHSKHCGCRPTPATLLAIMKKRR